MRTARAVPIPYDWRNTMIDRTPFCSSQDRRMRVVPGSEVAVFVTVDQQSASVTATATQDGDTATVDASAQVDGQLTQLLLPRASVIAVGPSTLRPTQAKEGEAAAEPIATAVLTLAVSQDEAEKLVHSVQTGSLYFGLLTSTSKTEPNPGVSALNLFS
jgi:pilus assembly protein CpaB